MSKFKGSGRSFLRGISWMSIGIGVAVCYFGIGLVGYEIKKKESSIVRS